MDETVCVYRLEEAWTLVVTLDHARFRVWQPAAGAGIMSLCFCSGQLASGSADGIIRVFNFERWDMVDKLECDACIIHLCFAPGLLTAGASDGHVRVFHQVDDHWQQSASFLSGGGINTTSVS